MDKLIILLAQKLAITLTLVFVCCSTLYSSAAELAEEPSVTAGYEKFFVHYVGNRTSLEVALNLVGLTGKDVGRSFALIVGVTAYPKMPVHEQTLEPANVDIAKLVSYLVIQERFEEVVVLKDEDFTLDNLYHFLVNYFPTRLSRFPRSRFFFAFSGHGMNEGTRGYLLKSSARSLEDKENGINMGVIRSLMLPVTDHGHHVLLMINSCYAGSFLRRAFGPVSRHMPTRPGAHVITAGGPNELVYSDPEIGPGSLFFEKVLAGLAGRADTFPPHPNGYGGDGIITIDELVAYLRHEIQISSPNKATVSFGDISRHGSMGGFFFLNRNRQLEAGIKTKWNENNAIALGQRLLRRDVAATEIHGESSASALSSVTHKIDSALAELVSGQAVLNKIRRMHVGEIRDLHFAIGTAPTEKLAKSVKEKEAIETTKIRISDTMIAHLQGLAFDVIPDQAQPQAVSLVEPTIWHWQIKAKEKGTHQINLPIWGRLRLKDSPPAVRLIGTLSQSIVVEDTPEGWWNETISWLKDVHWIWTSLLIPIGGALFLLWRRLTRKNQVESAQSRNPGNEIDQRGPNNA